MIQLVTEALTGNYYPGAKDFAEKIQISISKENELTNYYQLQI